MLRGRSLLAAALVLAAGAPLRGEPAVRVVAVGDVQLGRGVARQIAMQGVDYPFARVRTKLRPADVTLFNLECALSAEGIPIPKRYSFKADPAAAANLARAGLNIAVLANNHSMDCGRQAFAETAAALQQHGLRYVGAGVDAAEANAPLILTANGLRVAVLARTAVGMDGVFYREDAPTVASLEPDQLLADVRAARREADVVIVSLHWGTEYAREPDAEQRDFAHALIDAGATLIVGHHPHTPQPVERYRNGLIAYSLGNFVFDATHERSQHGLILQCTLARGRVVKYRVTKTRIEGGQPRVERRDLRARAGERSSPAGGKR